MNAPHPRGDARLQALAMALTGLGVLPIVVLSLVLILPTSALSWMPARSLLTQALIVYAALILAFLGGIHWGQGVTLGHPARLIIAVLPALYAWGASLLPWPGPGWALAAGLLFMLVIDLRNLGLPRWYRRMRVAASLVVVVHLGAAAALTPNLQPKPEETVMTKNVLGTDLQLCSSYPRTGFYRDGRCETGPDDRGRHMVCAVVTEAFLEFTLQRGNDLITPRPDYNFPGLNPGDRWCLCALRWKEALEAGFAPPVVLEATHAATLDYVPFADLQRHAWSPKMGQ